MRVIGFRLGLIVVAAATQLGATDCGQVLRDPGFDLWCGDQLCTWKIVRGDVRRVSTWHDGDSGVELVGPDAAISQLSPVNDGDGTCIQFDLVADVSVDAEARLGIDIYGDGSIERSELIPAARWKPLSYKIRVAPPFTGIRFELSKQGTGSAKFANIGAEIVHDCDGLAEVFGGLAPLGAHCTSDSSCESGMCRTTGFALRCVGCTLETCGSGEVCGLGEPISPVLDVPVQCVPAGTDVIGEQCWRDEECASGICSNYACSTCRADRPCAAGETCGQTWRNGPLVCSPGGGQRATGESCTQDSDCASGRCTGDVRHACPDNRACGSDASCPVEEGLVPGACTPVGIQGGYCD